MCKLIASVITALLVLFAAPLLAQQAKSDLVAVAASGKTASAAVSAQAGRSPYFLFFDKKGALVEAVDNPYKDAGNAGIPALDFVASKGAKILVAEGFGPKIVEVMRDKGIRPIEFKGNAQDAVRKALSSN
jgi:predicted Fe-Mo cluster-binding NifX family protein